MYNIVKAFFIMLLSFENKNILRFLVSSFALRMFAAFSSECCFKLQLYGEETLNIISGLNTSFSVVGVMRLIFQNFMFFLCIN